MDTIRRVQTELQRKLSVFPVVGMLGARQVGKTTLAKQIAQHKPTIYLDLERPSDLAQLTDPELFLSQHSEVLVILDEIHRKPELFPILRALVDTHRHPGRFLILGSASPDLLQQSAQSLAGRIAYVELGPLTLDEVGPTPEMQDRLWLRGGFPLSFFAASDEASLEWRRAFIQTFLERDLPQFGLRVPAAMMRRFWQMLAHHHGQLWNGAQLAGSLGVSAPTVRHHLDILEGTLVARSLQPLHANLKKRLVKTPKVYLRDSGLLHALLGLGSRDEVLGHPIAGASWEGFALEHLLAHQPLADATFYRTGAGTELDLVLDNGNGIKGAEFKLSSAPVLTRGFWQSLNDLQIKQAQVVIPGEARYRLSESVEVIGLCQIAQEIRAATWG